MTQFFEYQSGTTPPAHATKVYIWQVVKHTDQRYVPFMSEYASYSHSVNMYTRHQFQNAAIQSVRQMISIAIQLQDNELLVLLRSLERVWQDHLTEHNVSHMIMCEDGITSNLNSVTIHIIPIQ